MINLVYVALGPGRGEFVEGGVDLGPGGHGHPVAETGEGTAPVGGIAYGMDLTVGKVFGDHVEQVARQVRFRGPAFGRRRGVSNRLGTEIIYLI
ncbi:MAG TPA: hypothetical protein VJT49_30450 [Amycolatopsis sp.]|uniref:hypothetical protein n=1 Tax=Amycolatopsis sp. TaxID=37632 RepID=UPI002B48CCBB|nr:hypothetical protein [Amycolatopsis sp.]HKS49353.1 hypothetical protein [Amycolatopsis sp.]